MVEVTTTGGQHIAISRTDRAHHIILTRYAAHRARQHQADHQYQASKFWIDVSDKSMHTEISDIGAAAWSSFRQGLCRRWRCLRDSTSSCEHGLRRRLGRATLPRNHNLPGKKTAHQVTGNVHAINWRGTQVCCNFFCAKARLLIVASTR